MFFRVTLVVPILAAMVCGFVCEGAAVARGDARVVA